MAQYWCYELTAVAARLQYREALMPTVSMSEVDRVIQSHRAQVEIRPRFVLPI